MLRDIFGNSNTAASGSAPGTTKLASSIPSKLPSEGVNARSGSEANAGAFPANLGDAVEMLSDSEKLDDTLADMDLLEQSQKLIIASSKIVTVRSRGGNRGSAWDDGSHNGVREITTTYGKCIDSIVIKYHENGKPVTKTLTDIKGDETIKIQLKCPNEFLTTVEVCTVPP
ncbi:uncharacterized protein [Typha angustifolia]|uniref:uncharacterized protein isoform X2 n=1 Tax=Typha angustifolia TaxID=59011 RepID=UPI003C301BCC